MGRPRPPVAPPDRCRRSYRVSRPRQSGATAGYCPNLPKFGHDRPPSSPRGGEGAGANPGPWSLSPRQVGLNHVAITYPDRESWLRQLAFLRSKGVPFHLRINHGMTHSVYISDPNGHGIEVLYELPPEVWKHDIDAAQNYSERLPTEGEEALVDTTDNPAFAKRS